MNNILGANKKYATTDNINATWIIAGPIAIYQLCDRTHFDKWPLCFASKKHFTKTDRMKSSASGEYLFAFGADSVGFVEDRRDPALFVDIRLGT